MQSVSSRIWTRVAVFISYDDNDYTTGTSYRSQQTIPVRGFIDTTMKFQRKRSRAKIFVVDDESPLLGLQNLLSAHSAKALGMITFNFTLNVSVPIPDKFPSLFDGKMVKISGVIINLHMESSVPPVTQGHHRIPFHVKEKQGCTYLHRHEEGKWSHPKDKAPNTT